LESSLGTHYLPKWPEVMITLSLVSVGFAAFRAAALHLPLFAEPEPAAIEEDLEPVSV